VAVPALGSTIPALAAPGTGSGLGSEPYTCTGLGEVTVGVPSDESPAGFADGAVYIATQITVYSGNTIVFQKSYGNRNGAGAPIECVGDVNGTTVDALVVPVGQEAK
jgi:hypothetical protein